MVGLERHWGFKLHKAPEVMLSSFVSFYFSDLCFYAIQFSHSVVSNSATPWTAPCPASLSITNSWILLKLMTIKSVMLSNHLIPVVPFSSCPQSLPASGSFPVSQLFAPGAQSIGASASASVLSMSIQG